MPMAKEPKRRFVLEWRNRWLTVDATTIDEMADSLEVAVARLREMAEAGVRLDEDSNMDDDFATLVTNDEEVAERFEFDEDDIADELDEPDDE
jgi:hypothetical protein